jgi:hypothetical protein
VAVATAKKAVNLSQTKLMLAKANKKNQKEREEILLLFQKILIKNKRKISFRKNRLKKSKKENWLDKDYL